MTVSIDQLTPEHQRVALEARARIAASIARCGLRQTVATDRDAQSVDAERSTRDE